MPCLTRSFERLKLLVTGCVNLFWSLQVNGSEDMYIFLSDPLLRQMSHHLDTWLGIFDLSRRDVPDAESIRHSILTQSHMEIGEASSPLGLLCITEAPNLYIFLESSVDGKTIAKVKQVPDDR